MKKLQFITLFALIIFTIGCVHNGPQNKKGILYSLSNNMLKALEFESGIDTKIVFEDLNAYDIIAMYDYSDPKQTFFVFDINYIQNIDFPHVYRTLMILVHYKVVYEGSVLGLDDDFVGKDKMTENDIKILTCYFNKDCFKANFGEQVVENAKIVKLKPHHILLNK